MSASRTSRPARAPASPRVQQALLLHQRGELAAAERLYLEVLAGTPRDADALHYLGVLDLQRGRFAAAAERIGAAAALDGGIAAVHANLATAQHGSGRPEAALASLERAIALDRRFAGAFVERGNVLLDLGRAADARQSFAQALKLEAADPAALNGLGNAEFALGEPKRALASFERALLRQPDAPWLHANRAAALAELARPAEALAACERALAAAPADVSAQVTRANALLDLGRTAEALAAYDAALALDPARPRSWNNRGNALYALRRHEAALASFERALALDGATRERLGNRLNTRYNRCAVLTELNRGAEAGAAFEELLADAPDYPFVRGRALHARLGRCEWGGYEPAVEDVVARVRAGEQADVPFSFLAISDDAAAQLTCARTFAAATLPRDAASAWRARPRAAGGRLRIAYLSADFHEHATSQLAAGLFEAHDRARFEVTGVSFGPDDGSALRARVRAAFEHFIDVGPETDAAVAGRLRAAGIDIAVDLKGFTGSSRAAILCGRPAPLAVSFLGYPGTMGVDWIDYLVADRVVVPDAQAGGYQEAVVRLPGCYQVNDSMRPVPPPPPPREALGLPAEGFVFACFNASYKLNPPLFDVWMRLLAAVPGSVLWLLEDHAEVSARLRREARDRGVAPERLVFAPRSERLAYLARQRHADLFLDTFPVNAHTTASDALWMGLPVLTLAGEAFASRVAASLLLGLGVPELVTHDLESYESAALALARTPGRLAGLRARIDSARLRSGVYDSARFCGRLEAAFEAMWARHERGEAPASFDVPDDR